MFTAAAEYVLPLLRHSRAGEDELVDYLDWLGRRIDVTVVDGSNAGLFDDLHARLPPHAQHLPPRHAGLNGKARGVMTGVGAARHELVVIADDDVRYDDAALAATLRRLAAADVVRPQNVYSAHPWHARIDTARMLIGRAFGGDFGGTLGIRRSVLHNAGGYDTDVLFENLELERTARCFGGTIDVARDIYVERIPPTPRHFLSQRVRQAYDSLAQPPRLFAELAIAPFCAIAVRRRAWRTLLAAAALVVATAESGRRLNGGAAEFPRTAALWSPIWVLERGVTVWMAVGLRVRGGVKYAGRRIVSAGTPVRRLRVRAEYRRSGFRSAGGPE